MLKKTNPEPSALDEAIDRVLNRMQYLEPETDEYSVLLNRLDKLNAIKISNKDNRNKVSADTLLSVGANILGIVLILGYEKVNVVTSKALGFVVKSKV